MQLVEANGDMERGTTWKPKVEISPNCTRCGSSNTKFCYYNHYSLTQPRYFCKGCRRYWTKGGSLRNVPVGGGCRRNRRFNNKTLKQSNIIDAVIPSKNLTYDRRKDPSSTSSPVSEPPNIDLALVYANFLNQKPDSKPGLEKQEMQAAFDSSIPNAEIGPSFSLPEELSFNGCLNPSELSSAESLFNQMYFCGFNKVREDRIDTINFELPPLPSEETVSHDMMKWSNSHEMMANRDLQATQPPVFQANEAYEEVLIGNWSHFDLPKDASFSMP